MWRLLCRSALARDGVLKIADAGKPDCYGNVAPAL
jgi:hypothetical protein